MVEITVRLDEVSQALKDEASDRLPLTFEQRQDPRLRTRLVSGEEVALTLPRGSLLRSGDLLVASDGRIILVVASAERLMHIECGSPTTLARAAYLLGRGQVPIQVGDGFLRCNVAPAIEGLLKELGARVKRIEAAFEPELDARQGAMAPPSKTPAS